MEARIVSLEECETARGTVVVIDVLRAFSAAAFAFGAGVREILLVRRVEEALALREKLPGSRIAGEKEGRPVEGFDFDNSPAQFAGADLRGLRLIQRTSAGTQGVVLTGGAEHQLAASFCVAGATARLLKALAPREITYVITGRHDGADGDEDLALADYIQELLLDRRPDPAPYLARVPTSSWGSRFGRADHPWLPRRDLELCLEIDRFDFAMPVRRRAGLLALERSLPAAR